MSSRHAAPRGRRRLPMVVGTVVVVLAVVVGAFLLVRGGPDEPSASDEPTAPETESTTATTPPPTSASPSPTGSQEVPDEPEATQPTETAGPGDDGASSGTEDPDLAAMAGTWATDDNFWVLRLTADGTFEEDYEGFTNTRSGTYTLEGKKFTLRGGDGNDNSGTLVGKNRLRFDADTVLVRRR